MALSLRRRLLAEIRSCERLAAVLENDGSPRCAVGNASPLTAKDCGARVSADSMLGSASPMSLRAITVENYRCFCEPMRLELRPLTLLYGPNNAGKSTAAGLIELLGRSVAASARAPLDSSADLGYRDLVWRPAETKPGALRFALEWDDSACNRAPLRARWRLDLDRDRDRMYVRELELVGGVEDLHLKANRDAGPEMYIRRGSGAEEAPLRIPFRGLVPHSDEPALAALSERLRALEGCCAWIGGDRVHPPRMIPFDAPVPLALRGDGAGATELLLHPQAEALLAAVGAWYARPEIRRRLIKREVTDKNRQLLLNPPPSARFDVPLADAGAGMGQILPVLTAIAQAKERTAAGADVLELLAIEEPESQLHPDAQRALGDWIVDQMRADPSPRLILETHSRVLIMTIQLALARGLLDPARVGVYWLEQRETGSTYAAQIEFDRFGRPDSQWPSDVFADELELAELLTEEQIDRGAWDE